MSTAPTGSFPATSASFCESSSAAHIRRAVAACLLLTSLIVAIRPGDSAALAPRTGCFGDDGYWHDPCPTAESEPEPAPPTFRERMISKCAGQVGDRRLADGLEAARNGEDHNRIIVVVELCAITFEATVERGRSRPLSNYERIVVDRMYDITVNDEMLRRIVVYADVAWAWPEWFGSESLDSAPESTVSEPTPRDCYFYPGIGRWLRFEHTSARGGAIDSYPALNCGGARSAYGAYAVGKSAAEVDDACTDPTAFTELLVPEPPSTWYECAAAA